MATETGPIGATATRPGDIGLRREMGLIGATWASETSIIGSGWLFAGMGAAVLAGPAAIYGWLIGGGCAIVLALLHAELGAMYPVAGGAARFPHLAYGSVAGVSFGFFSWLQAVTVAPVECYAVMTYGQYYWHSIYDQTTGRITTLGFGMTIVLMAIFTAVNFLAVRLFSRVNAGITWWKVAIPLLTIIIFFFKFHAGNFNPGGGGFMPFGMKAVFGAIPGAGIVFSYLGFEQADQLAGEVKNPQKVLPRAIITAMAIGTFVYIMVQVVFIAAMDPTQLTHGFPGISNANVLSGPIAGLAGLAGLGLLATVLRIDAFVSPYGTGLIYLTSTSRVTYGLSRNRYLPQIFQRTDVRGVPWASMILAFVAGCAFLLPFPTWQSIVALTTGASVLMYIGAPLSLTAFRNRLPDAPRPYRLPAALIISPLAFIVGSLLIYWSGFEALWKLGICIVIGYFLIGLNIAFEKEKPRLGRK